MSILYLYNLYNNSFFGEISVFHNQKDILSSRFILQNRLRSIFRNYSIFKAKCDIYRHICIHESITKRGHNSSRAEKKDLIYNFLVI